MDSNIDLAAIGIDVTDQKKLMSQMSEVDALTWAQYMHLQLSDGVEFSLEERPYLTGFVHCDKPVLSAKKGSQVCATTGKFIEALHACAKRKYTSNIIYMMPTVKQVETLAKVSFDPIFRFNPWLKKMTSNDSASIKTVNGRSIVFVGAQPQKIGESAKDSVNLRSIPADAVYRDEIDLMDVDMVEMSKQRLNASKHRIECNFGSPTIPGYGIDLLFEEGDQRKWQIPCRSCGKFTCLVEDFPHSIIKKDGRWFRACVHCHNEIFVTDGNWVAEYPDRPDASFWIDGLITPNANLEVYMRRYHESEGTKLSEFQRSILGMAAIEAGCQLSLQDIFSCCGNDGLQSYTTMETCMGVDVGETMHVVIGIRTNKDAYRVLHVTTVKSFGELHDLAQKMNVKFCVIDKGPDIHGVKQFQKEEPYAVYRCQYSETMTNNPDFDRETGVVKCNRNEMCDRVHGAFVNNQIVIPRVSLEIKEYAEQLTKMAKAQTTHPETGVPKIKWVKIQNKADHYFHATLYLLLAASKTSPIKAGITRQRYTQVKNNFCLR